MGMPLLKATVAFALDTLHVKAAILQILICALLVMKVFIFQAQCAYPVKTLIAQYAIALDVSSLNILQV